MKKYEKPVVEMIELQIEEEIATIATQDGIIDGDTGFGSREGW